MKATLSLLLLSCASVAHATYFTYSNDERSGVGSLEVIGSIGTDGFWGARAYADDLPWRAAERDYTFFHWYFGSESFTFSQLEYFLWQNGPLSVSFIFDPPIQWDDLQIGDNDLSGRQGTLTMLLQTSPPEIYSISFFDPSGGDLNGDHIVDAADAAVMFSQWGSDGYADCNQDGIVDAADAGMMFEAWTGDTTSVPEPGVPMLVTAAAIALTRKLLWSVN